jgi:bloom syndrome protein
MQYFGEKFDKSKCNKTCDNCIANIQSEFRDISEHVRNIISMLKILEKDSVTINLCIDIYRGMKNQKVLENNYQELVAYGKGSNIKKTDMERIFHFLIVENALKESYVTNASGFTNAYVHVLNIELAWERLFEISKFKGNNVPIFA